MAAENILDELRSLADQLVALPGVQAVALGGSLARKLLGTGVDAPESWPGDADLYVYAEATPNVADRAALILERGASSVEVNNQFFETGDEWDDPALGVRVDVMYRSFDWIRGELDRVLIHHHASVGYSTCLWNNVQESISLADPTDSYAALQRRALVPYPDALRRAIVHKNWPLLSETHASFFAQAKSALERDDLVSVNHRVAAWLASFFDCLFALNLVTHPGEKRQLAFATVRCPIRPDHLDERVRQIVRLGAGNTDNEGLARMVELATELGDLLEETRFAKT